MDNHFHLIVAGENLPNIMRSLKRYTAQEILKTLEKDKKKWLLNQLSYYKKKHKKSSDHQVWQEGYHPQQIFSDEMYEQKVNYIHFNPVKRGFVSEEENWKYSSANNTDFDGNPIIVLDDVNEMRFE